MWVSGAIGAELLLCPQVLFLPPPRWLNAHGLLLTTLLQGTTGRGSGGWKSNKAEGTWAAGPHGRAEAPVPPGHSPRYCGTQSNKGRQSGHLGRVWQLWLHLSQTRDKLKELCSLLGDWRPSADLCRVGYDRRALPTTCSVSKTMGHARGAGRAESNWYTAGSRFLQKPFRPLRLPLPVPLPAPLGNS